MNREATIFCAVAALLSTSRCPLPGRPYESKLSLCNPVLSRDSVATLRHPAPPARNPVLSEGFARGARTSRSACPQSRSFRGICSRSSHIPLRLRRGGAKERQKKVQASLTFFCLSFAERTGFEPVSRFRRLHAFQACLFNHSSIFPVFRNAKI